MSHLHYRTKIYLGRLIMSTLKQAQAELASLQKVADEEKGGEPEEGETLDLISAEISNAHNHLGDLVDAWSPLAQEEDAL